MGLVLIATAVGDVAACSRDPTRPLGREPLSTRARKPPTIPAKDAAQRAVPCTRKFTQLGAATDFLVEIHNSGGDRSEVSDAETGMTKACDSLPTHGQGRCSPDRPPGREWLCAVARGSTR